MGESFFAGFAADNGTVVPQCWTVVDGLIRDTSDPRDMGDGVEIKEVLSRDAEGKKSGA